MGSPRLWVALGLGGLVVAGLGSLLFVGAWNEYLASNPGFRGDVAVPPSPAVGAQASVAVAMLVIGYVVALIASFVRLRRTSAGWVLLRALAALTPIPILWVWVRTFFAFYVDNLCGDCSPPQPIIPDVFTLGGNVLGGAAILGLVLFLVFLAYAIVKFVRSRRNGGPAYVA